jgi:RNA polymerase sigma-70 factor (ECF subfamily)
MPVISLITRRAASHAVDEADLVRRVAAGERSALEALYRGYQPRLTRFLARTTRRADVIEEVINDTFWIVWQKADRFRGDSRVSTWIMGIAYRCTLKCLREHGEAPAESPADDDGVFAVADPTSHHELQDWVGKGLARLPVEQRMALELAYGGGHTLEEIASIMDCQVTTVKARMFHARVKLRHLLPVLAGQAHKGAGEKRDDEANR